MKARAMQMALKQLREMNEQAAERAHQAFEKALKVPEIATSYADYVKCSLSAVADDTQSAKAFAKYIDALHKGGFDETDFAAPVVCPDCGGSGCLNGAPCHCVHDMYIDNLKKLSDIEKRAPFTFESSDLSNVRDADTKEELATLYGVMRKYADNLPQNVKTYVVTLSGGVGCGKTYLASAVARRAVDLGKSCVYRTSFEFHEQMLALHVSPIEDREFMLNDFLTADLMVLDDLGTEPIYRNVTTEYLQLVLDERIRRRLCTLITTNLSPDKLFARYNERIASRLTDRAYAKFVAMKGKDLRREIVR